MPLADAMSLPTQKRFRCAWCVWWLAAVAISDPKSGHKIGPPHGDISLCMSPCGGPFSCPESGRDIRPRFQPRKRRHINPATSRVAGRTGAELGAWTFAVKRGPIPGPKHSPNPVLGICIAGVDAKDHTFVAGRGATWRRSGWLRWVERARVSWPARSRIGRWPRRL